MSKVKNELLNVFDEIEKIYLFEEVDRKEVMEHFGLTSKGITERLAHGYKLQGRYLIERVEPLDPDAFTEWDDVRLKINPHARRG